MGKSAKFYKKPTLKEKQGSSGKSRSSASAPVSQFGLLPSSSNGSGSAKEAAVKKAAVSSKAVQKRQILEEKTKRKVEATNAPKPVFRPADEAISTSRSKQSATQEPEVDGMDDDEDDEDMDDTADAIKRRPRTKHRKDWGPMPKEMGIDYLRQWDSRAR
ncbi:hypothetical protein BCV70DRAFT_197330 [Testicularia cyperi]|uniref:Uncharacterized protein n=1 Tax=Testicularia cyperi TaxID=1882483 RepID=A0A317XYX3_9BASI|nr:hypothetical protein BCV70DRAFT_197330 [Testicularia cyperi]